MQCSVVEWSGVECNERVVVPKRALNVHKWSVRREVFNMLTSTCVSRHNDVHFFDIAISKSGPSKVCFVHFDFEMCFAPPRRAFFHVSSGQLAPHPPL